MRVFIGTILRWLSYFAAAGVMLLALLVGIARLMLPLVPDYQNEIRRWAGDATGFDVDFDYISASWPFAGPELRFVDVTISSRDDQSPILNVESLTVGISLIRLLLDRKVTLNRIGVETTRVEIGTDASGSILVQGRPVTDLIRIDPVDGKTIEFPALEIELDDVQVSYSSAVNAEQVFDFFVTELDLGLSKENVELEGSVEIAEEFGERAWVSLNFPVALLQSIQQPENSVGEGTGGEHPEWEMYLDGEDLRFDRVLEFLLGMDVPLGDTRGDIVIRANFSDLMPQNATVELDLDTVELEGSAAESETYESISGQLDWQRVDAGWRLAGSDLRIERANQVWPEGDFSIVVQSENEGGEQQINASANFLRLHDLYPIVLAVASEDVRTTLLPGDIRGDVRNFDLNLKLGTDVPAIFDLQANFDDLGFAVSSEQESISGISGALSADQNGGRLQIDSEGIEFALPDIFSAPLEVERIDGLLVWRVSENNVRVLSDNVQVRTPYASGNTRFEFNLPGNGDSPTIDLTASAVMEDVTNSLRYLPMKVFGPELEGWLERAIAGGRVAGAKLELRGALREFPYARGEGVFRVAVDVEDGVLDFADGWPRVEDLDTQVVFDGVKLYVTRNRGRIGGISFGNAEARMEDMRTGMLNIAGQESLEFNEMLGFLRASPVSDAIGPTLFKINGLGQLDAELRLLLPCLQLDDYELHVDVEVEDGTIGLDGLDYGFSAVTGALKVENTKIYAEALTAQLLDEPVTISIRPLAEQESLYTHFAKVSGATPVRRWMETLSLPFPGHFDGRINWNALALIPAREEEAQTPLHLLVRSDMSGIESTLPAPFAKDADSTQALEIDIAFPEDDVLEVSGLLRKEISWAMRLEAIDDGWKIERGAVHSGPAVALLPVDPGINLSGRLETLRFDDWLALTEDDKDSEWMELYRKADFSIGQLYLFGQAFSDVLLEAQPDDRYWQIDFDGPKIVGRVSAPKEQSQDLPIDVQMERLWLQETDPADAGSTDPRTIQSVRIDVKDFALRSMNFGQMKSTLTSVSAGIILDPIEVAAETFNIDGYAAWLVHPNDESIQQTQLKLDLEGTDIMATLTRLGYQPVMEGKLVRVSGDITWPDGPSEDFLGQADGTLTVNLEDGTLLEVEPGGGRFLGMLSVAAIPRRLSLDFRDVFDEGLAFDTLNGDFILNQGDAYTCNLKLEGSVADLGVVGRAGIAAEDYDQIAVVRPHVSSVLALPATVVGGPVLGGAVLLFTQLFKKPLSAIGESYYRVTGSWEEPVLEKIKRTDQLNLAPFKNCEQYLADENPRLLPE
jgi:uncharacterized protein (TIGR02099 family)